jgi:hypothetical protein
MWQNVLLVLISILCVDVYPSDEDNPSLTQVFVDTPEPTKQSNTTDAPMSSHKCPYTFPNPQVGDSPVVTGCLGGIGGGIGGYFAGSAVATATSASAGATIGAQAGSTILGFCIGTGVGLCIPFCVAGTIMLCCCKKRKRITQHRDAADIKRDA